MSLKNEEVEEFRKGLENVIKIARRFAQLGTDEFSDATEWEFMAGIMTLASWMSASISPAALDLAVVVAKDSVEHMGSVPKIGLVGGKEES